MNQLKAKKRIEQFLLEDVGDHDLTSEILFPKNTTARATIMAKDIGVLAGTELIELTYHLIDPTIEVVVIKNDGADLAKGETIATVTGNVQSILTGERVVLNLLQRMCGVATLTNQAVKALGSKQTKVLDTRKTTPGLRMFEKYAVTCGGGYNHRYGLYDGVMIKDNHIAHYGSISKAVEQVKTKLGHMVKVEVETENQDQVVEAVRAGADIIMFDNQSPEEIVAAIQYVPDSIVTEASGNINLTNIHSYRDCGVDYISLGFITHSAIALDISMNIDL
ncbi:nicotinate-nucleotide pyrophosphorylase (carboxylating) [Natronobacillus azotifigens]|uniref:Probable nicotinate-nucleotide pyrophosphorylase [carboxylating] n=1 Tax=Natronobacillus azotifigens TaxID=472978 RepID=A0A9J6R9W9_9BACI|nr:carboxylating nicotinate-nucleotide diphosphorylase [Natronobacillus azotifigens]MCZ0702381.1 carboxylating nicotinate-nucleotide diphosphorylase [Natronobacillus azotifigens]